LQDGVVLEKRHANLPTLKEQLRQEVGSDLPQVQQRLAHLEQVDYRAQHTRFADVRRRQNRSANKSSRKRALDAVKRAREPGPAGLRSRRLRNLNPFK
jgi:hypothetical protein